MLASQQFSLQSISPRRLFVHFHQSIQQAAGCMHGRNLSLQSDHSGFKLLNDNGEGSKEILKTRSLEMFVQQKHRR